MGDLAETFGRFADAWSPKIVGDVNDMHVKVVKLRGEFVWHHHDAEDELFLVVAGRLRMQLRDGDREVGPGQFIIVPRWNGCSPPRDCGSSSRGVRGGRVRRAPSFYKLISCATRSRWYVASPKVASEDFARLK